MGKIRFNRSVFKNHEHFRMHQRFQELTKAIQRWPNAAMIALRIKEKNELEEQLKRYED